MSTMPAHKWQIHCRQERRSLTIKLILIGELTLAAQDRVFCVGIGFCCTTIFLAYLHLYKTNRTKATFHIMP